jgi:hypothetical protein
MHDADEIVKGRRRGKAARADGKMLGRPKRVFRRDEAMRLRAEDMSWRRIAARLKVPVTTGVEGCR